MEKDRSRSGVRARRYNGRSWTTSVLKNAGLSRKSRKRLKSLAREGYESSSKDLRNMGP